MQLPAQDASTTKRIAYGRYTKQRCTRAGFADLATQAEAANAALLSADRELQDTGGPVQDAVADRDVADEDIDDEARTIRQQLAGRSLGASREEPYTLIFFASIEYYTKAPIGLEVTRYRELGERLAKYLAADDPIRVEWVPKLEAGISEWETARDAVEAARRVQSLARTARDAALAAWVEAFTQIYGSLIERVGKKKAEAFFQKNRSRAKAETTLLDEAA